LLPHLPGRARAAAARGPRARRPAGQARRGDARPPRAPAAGAELMPIERSTRRIGAARIASMARRLLDASPLCAIATLSAGGRAHVNTAYFAWSPEFELVWLSDPRAQHSRNVRAGGGVAI